MWSPAPELGYPRFNTLLLRHHAALQAYVGRSRNKRDRLEAAKELKALVFFSNIVVSALLEDVQARSAASRRTAPLMSRMTWPYSAAADRPPCM